MENKKEKNIKEKIQQKTKEIEDLETQIYNLEELEKLQNKLRTEWVKKIFSYDTHIRVLVGGLDDNEENNEVFFIYYRDFNQKELYRVYYFLLSNLNETAEYLRKRIAALKAALLK